MLKTNRLSAHNHLVICLSWRRLNKWFANASKRPVVYIYIHSKSYTMFMSCWRQRWSSDVTYLGEEDGRHEPESDSISGLLVDPRNADVRRVPDLLLPLVHLPHRSGNVKQNHFGVSVDQPASVHHLMTQTCTHTHTHTHAHTHTHTHTEDSAEDCTKRPLKWSVNINTVRRHQWIHVVNIALTTYLAAPHTCAKLRLAWSGCAGCFWQCVHTPKLVYSLGCNPSRNKPQSPCSCRYLYGYSGLMIADVNCGLGFCGQKLVTEWLVNG